MPQLPRKTRHLLRTVNNEPHATELDHNQIVKTKPSRRIAAASDNKAGLEVTATAKKSVTSKITVVKVDKRGRKDGNQDSNTHLDVDEDIEREPESEDDIDINPSKTADSRSSKSKKTGNSGVSEPKKASKPGQKRKSGQIESQNEDETKVQAWIMDDSLKTSKMKIKSKFGSKQYSKAAREFKQPPKIPNEDLKETKKAEFQVPPSLEPKVPAFQNPMEGIEHLLAGLPSLKTQNVKSSETKSRFQAVPATPDLTSAGNSSQSEVTDAQISHSPSSKFPPKIKAPKCPNCSAPIAKKMLDEFKAQHPFPRVSQQQAFCKEHKKAEGKIEWDKRGYPEIEWEKLDERMAKFTPDLINILANPETSFYRKRFQRAVEEGQGRNLSLQFWGGGDMKEGSVGYYGTKGLSMIMSWITPNLAQEIRKRVGTDRLIAARDVTGYIEMVLAPEMACMLIMQDLNIEPPRAREVLDESTNLGCVMYGERHIEPSDKQKKKMAREAKEKEKAVKKAAKNEVMESPNSRMLRSSPRGKTDIDIKDTPKKRKSTDMSSQETPKRTRKSGIMQG